MSGDLRKVRISFQGGPWDGETRTMRLADLTKANQPGQYRLDPNRADAYPLRYVWHPHHPRGDR